MLGITAKIILQFCERLSSAKITNLVDDFSISAVCPIDKALDYGLGFVTKIPDDAYCSDNQGLFRFSHNLDCDAFSKRKAIQLLTHPIWWTTNHVADRINLLDVFLEKRFDVRRKAEIDNCKRYTECMLKEENR
jgi:hypothetical protein